MTRLWNPWGNHQNHQLLNTFTRNVKTEIQRNPSPKHQRTRNDASDTRSEASIKHAATQLYKGAHRNPEFRPHVTISTAQESSPPDRGGETSGYQSEIDRISRESHYDTNQSRPISCAPILNDIVEGQAYFPYKYGPSPPGYGPSSPVKTGHYKSLPTGLNAGNEGDMKSCGSVPANLDNYLQPGVRPQTLYMDHRSPTNRHR